MLARIWRPGTTAQRVVTYRLLTTGSLEEKVHLAHTLRTYSHLTTDFLRMSYMFSTGRVEVKVYAKSTSIDDKRLAR